MLRQKEIDKIVRYIDGLSDDSEKTWVESQFLTGENNQPLRQFLRDDWDVMQNDTSQNIIDLTHVLDRVHHIIRRNETLKSREPMRKFVRIYIRAAAFLLLPIIITGSLLYSYLGKHAESKTEKQVISTIYAPFGARVSFNLPDGTKGMLNSGSRLSYSIPFTDNRQVKLEGEAWLEVTHDENHPFKIYAGISTLKVLGTSFNINAYAAENYVEIVLQQGSVEFEVNNGDEKVIMIPSERLILQNGNIIKSVTDPSKYSAWTEGKLVFRGDPMAEVARRLERWYNVKIVLADPELEKYSFRATFQDDTLEEVLRFLSMTSPIRFKITPRELLEDGTYKKEEITIYMK